MKIIKDFPKINVGDVITFIDIQNDLVSMKVKGTWYPKKSDVWNETEECEKMGYAGSNPKKPFPQLVGFVKDTNKGMCIIFGTDKNIIKTINGIKV